MPPTTISKRTYADLATRRALKDTTARRDNTETRMQKVMPGVMRALSKTDLPRARMRQMEKLAQISLIRPLVDRPVVNAMVCDLAVCRGGYTLQISLGQLPSPAYPQPRFVTIDIGMISSHALMRMQERGDHPVTERLAIEAYLAIGGWMITLCAGGKGQAITADDAFALPLFGGLAFGRGLETGGGVITTWIDKAHYGTKARRVAERLVGIPPIPLRRLFPPERAITADVRQMVILPSDLRGNGEA